MVGPEGIDEEGCAVGGAWRGGCVEGCSVGCSDAIEELIIVEEPDGVAVGARISKSCVVSFLTQNFWFSK